jgi:hypothetical protein
MSRVATGRSISIIPIWMRLAHSSNGKETHELEGRTDPADDRKHPFCCREGRGANDYSRGDLGCEICGIVPPYWRRTMWCSNGGNPSNKPEHELLYKREIDARIDQRDGTAAVVPGLRHPLRSGDNVWQRSMWERLSGDCVPAGEAMCAVAVKTATSSGRHGFDVTCLICPALGCTGPSFLLTYTTPWSALPSSRYSPSLPRTASSPSRLHSARSSSRSGSGRAVVRRPGPRGVLIVPDMAQAGMRTSSRLPRLTSRRTRPSRARTSRSRSPAPPARSSRYAMRQSYRCWPCL